MSPHVLPLWLPLIPVFTYGLLACTGRARLGQRLSQPIARPSATFQHLVLWWCAGQAAFVGLRGVNERAGGVLEQTVMFTLIGSVAYLVAANAELFKRWVWMDLLARMLAEIGLLGYVAALVSLQVQGDGRGWIKTLFMACTALTWLLYHLARVVKELPWSGRLASVDGAAV